MNFFNKLSRTSFAKAIRVCTVALVALVFCNASASAQQFYPWNNLSNYFNLNALYSNGSSYMFNTYSLAGNWNMTNEQVSGEYYGVILGTNVWVRSQPYLSQSTQLCKVNTGDRLLIVGDGGYNNGKHWTRVRLADGYYAGSYGYICSDYIIDQEMYNILCRYVFQRSNMSVANKSQHLHAVATVIRNLGANNYSPYQISVTKLSTSYSELIAFRITNNSFSYNTSMLAFVKCSSNSNNYKVVAIVPGYSINYVTRLSNGTYDIGCR